MSEIILDNEEWISLTAAAALLGITVNDMSSTVHYYRIVESRPIGRNRLVRKSEILDKADEIRAIDRKRRNETPPAKNLSLV